MNRRLTSVASSFAVLSLASTVLAGTWTITTNTTLTDIDMTHEGDDVIVRGATLTVNGAHSFASLAIERSTLNVAGVLTHGAAFDNGAFRGFALSISNNVTVQGADGLLVASRIDADGRGFPGNQGPGVGGSHVTAAGGGHGGAGGASTALLQGGATYGSITSPDTFGSGGGHDLNTGWGGGLGGGVIHLDVGGALMIDGAISCNGANAACCEAGGGAGGSVWISASSIGGAGVVRANGGNSGNGSISGGGGGGRIWLHASAFALDVDSQITAFGGGSGGYGGGAGTIVIVGDSAPASLIIDNGGDLSGVTEMTPTWFDGDVVVRHGARVGPRRFDTSMQLTVTGDCTVATDGAFFADGLGYLGNEGPGAGGTGAYAAGAGHGGGGGDSGNGASGGGCYDDFLQPVMMGSGGGHDLNTGTGGGVGGGVLRLSVGGALVVDGSITARGYGGTCCEAGGGAGGSIWIDCGTIAGSGAIVADGGTGANGSVSGGGSGGRIALYAQQSTFDDTHFSAGGGSGVRGGAGTIWFEPEGTGTARMIIDNNGNLGETTEFAGDVTIPGNLVVRNAGRLGPPHLDTAMHVSVVGDATIASSGVVYADGRGEPSASGPGAGTSGSYGAGAGHGGAGGDSGTASAGGDSYDDFMQPTQSGSGGGNDTNTGWGGGIGGGVIRLSVTGTLHLEGEITADGLAGTCCEAGGGAGGSIWIDCGSLDGAGYVTVTGGSGANGSVSGGGGGGRIAMYSATSTFDDTHFITTGGGGLRGGGGTAWFERVGPGSAVLIADNGGYLGEATEFTGAVDIAGDLLVRNGARVGPKHMDDTLQLNVAGDATIDVLGAIYADGRGYPSASGPGAGTSGTYAGGAGHGGAGANSGNGYAGGGTYGNFLAPVALGSGGGNDTNTGWGGGVGGGVLRMNVEGTLRVDGEITADGFPGTCCEAGGGAGGSIWIECGSFEGAGAITANGGAGSNGSVSGGGGGGRVALLAANSTFDDANFHAVGGSGVRGGAGTVWFEPNGAGSGTLIVDNDGFNGEMTEFSGDVLVPGGVKVREGGRLGPTHGDATLAMYVSNSVVVGAGASIDADARGYGAASGPGAGANGTYAAGGGHGGRGGNSSNGAVGGTTYDSIPAPGQLGSGGGNDTNAGYGGGAGGGVIRLVAGGEVVVDGRMSADGSAGIALEGGGGAGGSIFLFVAALDGSGVVRANGGAGANSSVAGGGGGGRVAVYTCDLGLNPTSIVALGAARDGQPGTAIVFSGSVEITTQPIATSAPIGASAQFSVVASGDGDLSYHWRRNGEFVNDDGDITGATTSTLHIANVSCADAGNYDCVVTDACGYSLTEAVPLTAISFADLNGDCFVNAADIGILLGQWGGAGSADFNGDGIVGAADLGMLLGAWNS